MAPKNRRRIYSNASKKKTKNFVIRCEKCETTLTSILLRYRQSGFQACFCQIHVYPLLVVLPCILHGVTDRLALSIMAERAGIRIERTITQLPLRSRGDCKKLLEKRRRSFFSLGAVLHLISHLSQLLHELAHALAVLEWAALFESRAVTSQAFALGDKDSVWTHTFAKCWTLEHRVVQGDAIRGLMVNRTK